MKVTEEELAAELRNVLRHAHSFVTHATATAPEGWDDPQTTWGVERYRWEPDTPPTGEALEVLPLDVRPGETFYEAWLQARHPDDFLSTAAELTQAFRSGTSSVHREFRAIDKFGHVHWISQVSVIEPVAGQRGRWRVTSINTDISEAKRAQEALHEVTRHARCILNYGEVVAEPGWRERAIAGVDPPFSWYVEVANVESAQELFPLDVKPGESYQLAWAYSRHPDDARQMNVTSATAFLHGDKEYQNDFRCTDRNGRQHWMHQRVTVRELGEGRWRTFGIAVDVSERKQVEEQLALAKAAAEEARAAAEQARASAEAASAAKDHFLAVLSHELRTPLAPVVTSLDMLQQQPGLDSATLSSLELIHRNVVLEARLIDDLLDVTRIARGKIELERRPICLGDVIGRAVDVVAPDVEARQLQFKVQLNDLPCLVDGDATRLQQVFWNLLRNAIKFTHHGGSVSVSCWKQGSDVIAEVRDNGSGIAVEDLQRIFNAFEQAERSVSRQFGGLGLGLTISKALVEMHGGEIEARSEGRGKGAAFVVRLPQASTGLPLPAVPMPLARAARPQRILLVEDHGDTAKVMRHLLTRQGHTVEWAGDVATGIQMACAETFDLLISDLGLPDGSGVDMLRELRRRGCHVPAIAISGYGQEQDMRRSREAGFAVHLVKPASPQRLAEVILAVTEAASAE